MAWPLSIGGQESPVEFHRLPQVALHGNRGYVTLNPVFCSVATKPPMANKVLITIFSMLAELERDLISERTKEGLQARKDMGIKLGKPKGVIQASMYDKDKDKIFHLFELGVPLTKIIETHLGYGKYLSLKYFIGKRSKSLTKPC